MGCSCNSPNIYRAWQAQTGGTKSSPLFKTPKSIASPQIFDFPDIPAEKIVNGITTVMIPKIFHKDYIVVEVIPKTRIVPDGKQSVTLTIDLNSLELLADDMVIGHLTGIQLAELKNQMQRTNPIHSKTVIIPSQHNKTGHSLNIVKKLGKGSKWLIKVALWLIEFLWYDAQLFGPMLGIAVQFTLAFIEPTMAKMFGIAVITGISDIVIVLKSSSWTVIFGHILDKGKRFMDFYNFVQFGKHLDTIIFQ